MEPIKFNYTVPGDDFTAAGQASTDLKRKLKVMGVDSKSLRNINISLYEGEINLAIHAGGGEITPPHPLPELSIFLFVLP